jgi:hypothetical protein
MRRVFDTHRTAFTRRLQFSARDPLMVDVLHRLASGEVVLRPAKAGAKARLSLFAKLRGRATVRMKTEEIMALTRGA